MYGDFIVIVKPELVNQPEGLQSIRFLYDLSFIIVLWVQSLL